MVFQVKCGTGLYRFLIFGFFYTFNGTNITIISEVDQNTYGKVTITKENTSHDNQEVSPFLARDF